ncbi:MAG: hypothetical protein ACWGO1_09205, partial [Anaerolineales bacterium]
LEEVLDHDLDERELQEIKRRLEFVIEEGQNPDMTRLADSLYTYFDRNELALTPTHPGWMQRLSARLAELEDKYLDRRRMKRFLVAGILILGIGSIIVPGISTIFYVASISRGETLETIWFLLFQVILLGTGILLVTAALRIWKGAEESGLRTSYITLLVYLTIINIFLFYFYQFAIIIAALFQFALLLGVLHYQRRYGGNAELPDTPEEIPIQQIGS